MNTPRDLLLKRHQAAVPRLDAIRRSVVAGLNRPDPQTQSGSALIASWFLGGAGNLWRELVWPCRRTWTVLAAVWMLLVLVNISQREGSPGPIAHAAGPGLSLQAQQRWMNELLADRSLPPDADRPRTIAPKPRTENVETATV